MSNNNWIYYLTGSIGTIILIVIGIILYRCYYRKNVIVRRVQPLRGIYSISGNLCREYGVMETISDIYEIDEPLLGRGSSGDVMTAIHKGTSRKYAVKIIDISENAKSLRYEREMEMLREVNHTNIVRLISVFQCPLTKFFVMELCKG
jgi:serine/threonine protein kinase